MFLFHRRAEAIDERILSESCEMLRTNRVRLFTAIAGVYEELTRPTEEVVCGHV